MSAIDIIEAALLERYNVRTLDGLGSLLPEAVTAARNGDWEPLERALSGRELYRWRGIVDEALSNRVSPTGHTDSEPVTTSEPETVEGDEETQKAGAPSSKPRKGRGE